MALPDTCKMSKMSRVTEENDPLILNHKFSVMKTKEKVKSYEISNDFTNIKMQVGTSALQPI